MKPIITTETFKDPAFRKEVYEMLIKHYVNLIANWETTHWVDKTEYMCMWINAKYDVGCRGVQGLDCSLDTLLPELIRPSHKLPYQHAWYNNDIESCQLRLENCKQALAKLIENGN